MKMPKITGWVGVMLVTGLMVGGQLLGGIPLARKALWGLAAVTAVWVGYQEIVG